MASNTFTVADLFLQALEEAGVDYMFTVLGSDLCSILEAYMRRQRTGKPWPKMLHFQHEFVAISAADGYGRITGRPQCVLTHVDVGTAALGQGLHNASTGRAPMLIFAGLAPLTLNGELPGSRTEHVHWMHDVPNQAAIVSPYVRYSNEIKVAEHVRTLVWRALLMARTGSAGPAYLTAAREITASPVKEGVMVVPTSHGIKMPSCHVGGLPEAAVVTIGEALRTATDPLVITSYLGRNHSAVRRLLDFANLLPSLKVHDSEFREMSFPADHPAWITKSTGADTAIRNADVVLILDCDVPWIPTKVRPAADARIFHIDIDPRKERMQLYDFGAEETFLAECDIALEQLCHLVAGADGYDDNKHSTSRRSLPGRAKALADHQERLQTLQTRAQPNPSGSITVSHLFAALKRNLPPGTIYVHDAVTNTTKLFEQLQLTAPGTCLGKGGAGLGWAGGAAIGVQLALRKYDISSRPHVQVKKTPTDTDTNDDEARPPPLVCSITGDGAYIFGIPTATYWAQKRLKTPFLTVVVNNGGWKATKEGLRDVHPGGFAHRATEGELGIDLSGDAPDYVGVAVRAANGGVWGVKVERAGELDGVLGEAGRVVREEGRGVVVEVVVVVGD